MASQSSVHRGATADRVNDGDNFGEWWWGSIALTDNEWGVRQWMDIDLGQDDNLIDTIILWNRTDCCYNRMKKVYIVVSDNPITGDTLEDAQASAGSSTFYLGDDPIGDDISVSIDRTARYVRVFNRPGARMNLAEIEILGQGPGQ